MLCGVAHHRPSSQLALAQLTGLDRTVVTYLLDDLVSAGMVERTADPADREAMRSLLMRVTLRIQNDGAEAFTCASVDELNNS